MPKIIMTKGLPGSGKSTWALEQVKNGKGKIKMVSKDDLRKMIDGGVWSGRNEGVINSVRSFVVKCSLREGCDVIVADTGFNPVHEESLKAIAKDLNAAFEINDSFCSVPVEECIKRDLKRPDSVGEAVIRAMSKQYLEPKV
jgi:predicted kinase